MDKFTIFTIILSVSVITVTADLIVRDYHEKGQASVLGQRQEEVSPVIATPEVAPPPEEKTPPPPPVITPPPAQIVEPVFTPPPFVSKINQDILTQAGFKLDFSPQQFGGKVFQLLDITQNPVDDIHFYQLSDQGVAVASITEIALRDEIRALQMYSLLQNKTKPYIDLTLNETNAYGDSSFYINHVKKPDEAFLTVKIGKAIYAFAYLKNYHPALKKLIELLGA